MRPFKPTHQSFKQVEAYPLVELQKRDGDLLVAIVSYGAYPGPIEVPADIIARGEPEPGSMLVRYAPDGANPDGYLAFSPREAFNAGYRPIAATPEGSLTALFASLRAAIVAAGTSRELSVAVTHLDAAWLWAGEHKGA